MTVEEIIDQALRQGDNVSPTSADYLERRRLALSFLREVVGEWWWIRDWPCKRKNTTLQMTANACKVDLPLDFNSFGVFGKLFTDLGNEMTEVPESVIFDFNADPSYSVATPRYFSVHGQDETTYLGYIQVPRNASLLGLQIFYQSEPPFMLDAGDTDGYGTLTGLVLTYSSVTGLVTATKTDHGYENGQNVLVAGATPSTYNGSVIVIVTGKDSFTYVPTSAPASTPATGTITSTLDVDRANRSVLRIPSRYHGTLLVWGVRAKLRESKGDARYQFAQAEFVKAVRATMMEEARDQTRRQGTAQLPSFFGRPRGAY